MTETRLYLIQRLSAMVLAPLVLGHIGLIIYAVDGGLTASEILDRTRGSMGWGAFYGVFVAAVALHAPIGLRNFAREWLAWRGRGFDRALFVFSIFLLALGARAVWSVCGVPS